MSVRITCASCGHDRARRARGLCNTCWNHHQAAGTLGQFPPTPRGETRPRLHRVTDYAELRAYGELLDVAARRLGVSARTAWRYEARLRQVAA